MRWHYDTNQQTRLYKFAPCETPNSQPVMVSHSILLEADMSWKVFVYGHHINRTCSVLSLIPDKLNSCAVMKLISNLDSANICRGYPMRKYTEMAKARKGVLRDKDGADRAKVDTSCPVVMNGESFDSTIRTTKCEIVTYSPHSLCKECSKYGHVLRGTYTRWLDTSTHDNNISKYTNNRYLTSPQKCVKLRQLQQKASNRKKEKAALLSKIEDLTSKSGIEVDPSFHSYLLSIMEQSNKKVESEFREGSFRRLFWEQQFQASRKDSRQMRWHPMIVRYAYVAILVACKR